MHLTTNQLLFMTVFSVYAYFTAAKSLPTMTYDECEEKKSHPFECCPINQDFQLINTNEKLCCNGTARPHAHNVKCCGETYFYNVNELECCNGQLYNKNDDASIKCCDKELYNNKTQLCCEFDYGGEYLGRVYDIEPTLTTCPETYCAKQPYDASKHTCCNNKLVLAKTDHYCCGDELYDDQTQICCTGRIYEKHLGRECCGTSYMTQDQKCCDKKILKEDEKCCNGETYNSNKSQCAAGYKLIQIVPIEKQLCYDKEYDPKKEVCCGFSTVAKNEPDDNACCKQGLKPGVPYNNNTMECKDNTLYSKVICRKDHAPKEYICCDGYAYKQPAINSVCCDRRAEWYEPDSDDQKDCRSPPLCNNEWYNDTSHVCCNNTLINANKFKCIDNKAYEYYKKYDRFSSNLRICGSFAISKGYECCVTMPYKKRRHTCPFGEFGNEKPIKGTGFPFWGIIECRSKKKTGIIVKTERKGRRVTAVLKTRGSGKNFTINISDKQGRELEYSEYKKESVIVYYENSIGNELYLGEYGAIERSREYRRRNRRRNIRGKVAKNCEQINTFFLSGSNGNL